MRASGGGVRAGSSLGGREGAVLRVRFSSTKHWRVPVGSRAFLELLGGSREQLQRPGLGLGTVTRPGLLGNSCQRMAAKGILPICAGVGVWACSRT